MQKFISWTTQQRPHWRENKVEAMVAICVFGITGTASVSLVRPAINKLGLKGSMREGPWSYRIGSIFAVSPIYACVLFAVGTAAGRHNFFAAMSRKILSRFIPIHSVREKLICTPARLKNIREKAISDAAEAQRKSNVSKS